MGNPFVHLDLATDDLEGAKKFYKAVFDWKLQDFPQMNWTGIDVGGGVGGGMGKKQNPGEPTAWTPYVQVDDVKKAIAKAQKAGAKVVVPFMEVPGMGYLGVFVDPQGAVIGVWQQGAGGGGGGQQAEQKAEAKPEKKAEAKPEKKAAPAPEKKAAPAQKAPAKAAPEKKAAPAQKAPAKAAPAQKAPAKAAPAQKAPAKAAPPAKPGKRK